MNSKMTRYEKFFRLFLAVFMIVQLGLSSAAAVAQPTPQSAPVTGPKINIQFVTMNQIEDELADQLKSAAPNDQDQDAASVPDADSADEEADEISEAADEVDEEAEAGETEDKEAEESQEEETEETEEEEAEETEEEEAEESQEEEAEESQEEETEETEEEEAGETEEEETEESQEEEAEESEEEETEESQEEEAEETQDEAEETQDEAEETQEEEAEETQDEAEETQDEAEETQDEAEETQDEAEETQDEAEETNEVGGSDLTQDEVSAEEAACEGEDCPAAEVAACEGEDCPAAEVAACEGEDCPAAEEAACEGENCPVEEAAACEGEDCPAAEEAACEGEDCPAAEEAFCEGEDCPVEEEAACEGEDCPAEEPLVLETAELGDTGIEVTIFNSSNENQNFALMSVANAPGDLPDVETEEFVLTCKEDICISLGDPDHKIQLNDIEGTGTEYPKDWEILIDNKGIYHLTYTIPDFENMYDDLNDVPDEITIDLGLVQNALNSYKYWSSSTVMEPGDVRAFQVWIKTESGFTYKYIDGSFKLETADLSSTEPNTGYIAFDGQELPEEYTGRTSITSTGLIQPMIDFLRNEATDQVYSDNEIYSYMGPFEWRDAMSKLRRKYNTSSDQEAFANLLVDYYSEKDGTEYTDIQDLMENSETFYNQVIPTSVMFGFGNPKELANTSLPLDPTFLYDYFYQQALRFAYGEGYLYDADGNPISVSDEPGIQHDFYDSIGDPKETQFTTKTVYSAIDYDSSLPEPELNEGLIKRGDLDPDHDWIVYGQNVSDDTLCVNVYHPYYEENMYYCGVIYNPDGSPATVNDATTEEKSITTTQEGYEAEWYYSDKFEDQTWYQIKSKNEARNEINNMTDEEKAAFYEQAQEDGVALLLEKYGVSSIDELNYEEMSGAGYKWNGSNVQAATLTGLDYLIYQFALDKYIAQVGQTAYDNMMASNTYYKTDMLRSILRLADEVGQLGDTSDITTLEKAYGKEKFVNEYTLSRNWFTGDGTVGNFMEQMKEELEARAADPDYEFAKGTEEDRNIWGRTNEMFNTLLGEGLTADEAAMASFMFAYNIDGEITGNLYQDTYWGWDSEIKLEKVYDTLTINKVDEKGQLIGAGTEASGTTGTEGSGNNGTSEESSEDQSDQATFQVWYYKENKKDNTLDKYYYTMITDEEGNSAPGFAKYDPNNENLSYTIDTTDGKLEMTYPRIAGAVYYLREVNAPYGYVTDTTVRIICDTEEQAEKAKQRLLDDTQITGEDDHRIQIKINDINNAESIDPELLKTENGSRYYGMDFENVKETETTTQTPSETTTPTPSETTTSTPPETITPTPETPTPSVTVTPVPSETTTPPAPGPGSSTEEPPVETPVVPSTPETPGRSYPTDPEWQPEESNEIPPRRMFGLLEINDYRVPLAGLVNMNEGDCFD